MSLEPSNSKTLSAAYDQDYRPTNRTVSGVFNHAYDTDNNGNIVQKGVRTYTYDALERLNAEAGGTATSFTYDPIGNRLTEVAGTTTTYTYPSTNNKVSSVGTNSYTYDSAGNVTGDTARTYVWSAAGLMKEAKIGGTTVGTYTYSASNQRTKKVAGGVTTHYVYGLGGKLYGEYDSSGVLIREYVYLNGEPLAQILKSGGTETVTYLHTDHLATPRYGTNAAGSKVWTWDSGAFGKEAATGTATVNLRFPGQYFDSETTLFYNWNRFYNPAIGRYISSDPIGLAGGLNTYGYVSASPVKYSDPEGLIRVECPPIEWMLEDSGGDFCEASNFFHCGYNTYKECHEAKPWDTTNECVYDNDGCLVTQDDPDYPGCAGSPNEYPDNDHGIDITNNRHIWIDEGGIWNKGWEGTQSSTKKIFDDVEDLEQSIGESIGVRKKKEEPKICGCIRQSK